MRLQTFFWLAAALAVAFSAINWLGLAGWLASLVIFGSLAMHIAGNAIGTRMREATDRDLSRTHQRTSIVNVPAPSPSHLEQHSRTGWLLPISVSIGGLIGGISGTRPVFNDILIFCRNTSGRLLFSRTRRYLWLPECQLY